MGSVIDTTIAWRSEILRPFILCTYRLSPVCSEGALSTPETRETRDRPPPPSSFAQAWTPTLIFLTARFLHRQLATAQRAHQEPSCTNYTLSLSPPSTCSFPRRLSVPSNVSEQARASVKGEGSKR